MDYKSIYLKKGKDESLKRFHPWVFSGAIAHMDEGINEGDVVRLLDCQGTFMAVGHFQFGTIMVRVLSFEDIAIDESFWEGRLRKAYESRKAMGLEREDNNTFRLVHGEGDFLPGLIVDCYGNTAVMQAHSVGIHCDRMTIAEQLVKVMGGTIRNVYYKSETTLPAKMAMQSENQFLIGGSGTDVAMENGLQFHVDWLKGQKTGFFVDQRDNRSLLERYAKDRVVLNMFCYTGGFSFYAMRGDARCVHSVDSSAKAIELTNANVQLNFPEDSRHEAFCEDAFKFHLQLLAGGEQRPVPHGGIHGGCTERAKSAHTPPVAPAFRPSHQHLPP